MGNQLCKCQNQNGNSNSGSLLTKSMQRTTNSLPTAQQQTPQLQQQQFDNPSRDLLNRNFLKTSFTASNNLLKLQTKSEGRKSDLSRSTLEPISFYKMESSQYDSLKRMKENINLQNFACDNLNEQRQMKSHRRPSIECNLKLLEQLDQISREPIPQSETAPEILRSISDYILSQKNLFEPIKVTKQNFVRFKYQDIYQSYTFLQKVGEGSYGIVYKVKSKHSGEIRAAKLMKKSRLSEQQRTKLMNEINILRKLDHPSIIKIYEVFMYENVYCIITEYCEGGSLFKHMKQKKYKQATIKNIFRKLMQALSYIHRLNIIHRDMKLDNIVLVDRFEGEDDNCTPEIRIIDFGLAKVMPARRVKDREKIGTYTHMAPEVLTGIYSFKCDIWSAGVILFLMVTGVSPFRKSSKDQTYRSIVNDDLNFNGEVWRKADTNLKDLLLKLLNKNFNARISALQALNHPYLKINKEDDADKEVYQKVTKKFCDYNRGNNLVSIIESYIAYTETDPKKQQELAEMFETLDTNGSGYIEREQLKTAFERSGISLPQDQMHYLLNKIDKNHSGKIDYSEFITIFSDRNNLFKKDSLISAFNYLDTNNDGYLNKEELRKTLKEIDNKELSGIIREIDMNRDDKITQEEFITYLQQEK